VPKDFCCVIVLTTVSTNRVVFNHNILCASSLELPDAVYLAANHLLTSCEARLTVATKFRTAESTTVGEPSYPPVGATGVEKIIAD
jgi:hypothetical protein